MAFDFALRILAMALAVAGSVGTATAGVLEDVKARGELIVGVKADTPPYGYRLPAGEIVGMELDLAKDLADRLGVKLKLWPVSPDSRLQFLEQGQIDLLIATLAVTDERRKRVALVEPFYYASGIAVIAKREAGVNGIGDLAGKPFCALRDAYFRDDILARAGGSVFVPVRNLDEGRAALAEGKCVGLADEDVRLIHTRNSAAEAWKDYRIAPLDLPLLPWAIAVRTGEKDTPFGKLVSATVTDWHKSGKLLELEKKWLGENTKWLSEAHERAK
ncbi:MULTISPECIES: transporter substrate-binding domain-containing protein [Rhodomicrobium]|uniref:transporter substrate-binding domain-containing protein n=1 Tax=Rhodomicrobium TaxID=1068 RepID=UPI000F73A477|nr:MULTISPECIES: transporter substrate-binding domain-containing protein [Rhodomicrobium]